MFVQYGAGLVAIEHCRGMVTHPGSFSFNELSAGDILY